MYLVSANILVISQLRKKNLVPVSAYTKILKTIYNDIILMLYNMHCVKLFHEQFEQNQNSNNYQDIMDISLNVANLKT